MRVLATGALAGGALALLLHVEYTSLRGPLELSLMKYRFLAVAAESRKYCQPTETFLFEDDDTSPVVLCRARDLPPGFLPITDAPPSVGSAQRRETELPGIFVPEPLF
jgi:hypothetical protein